MTHRLDATALDTTIEEALAAGNPLVIAGVTGPDETSYLRGLNAEGDTVLAVHSATKLFTATAALQCVEDGLIDLDAPARTYVPAIGDLGVLVALDDDGAVVTRPSAREITPRMLLLHTAGLGYDMFDARYAALARARQPSATPLRDSITTPLLHDPGERWTYGTSIDWLGLVVEAVRGERLDAVVQSRIAAPCGMTSTSFDVTPAMLDRLAPLYRRGRDGELHVVATPPLGRPEADMGGQGLYSTVPDLLALLRVWLGDGSAPGGRVLRPETISWATRTAPGVEVSALPAAIPALTRPAEFHAGLRTGWGYSFLVVEDDVPDGRRAGSFSWAGLANVHWWVDRTSGVAAVWATQLLPFLDPVAREGVDAFERVVYALADEP